MYRIIAVVFVLLAILALDLVILMTKPNQIEGGMGAGNYRQVFTTLDTTVSIAQFVVSLSWLIIAAFWNHWSTVPAIVYVLLACACWYSAEQMKWGLLYHFVGGKWKEKK